MSTISWILWIIGVTITHVGTCFTFSAKRKKKLMGRALIAIGLIFNGFFAFFRSYWVLGFVSFIVADINYTIFKKEKKELDKEDFGIKEEFLKELKEYKFKLDRKNYKIV